MPDQFGAFRKIFGSNTLKLDDFLKLYASIDFATAKPQFFNLAFVIDRDAQGVAGQKTKVNFKAKLSTEIVAAHADPTTEFIQNYSHPDVKAIYESEVSAPVSVTIEDLKKIILYDFANNSNPADPNDL